MFCTQGSRSCSCRAVMKPLVYDKRTVRRLRNKGSQQGGCPDCLLEFQSLVRYRQSTHERACKPAAAEGLLVALEGGPHPTGLSIEEQRRIFERERAAILIERGESSAVVSARPSLLGLTFFGEADDAIDAVSSALVENGSLMTAFDFDFNSEIQLDDSFESPITRSRLSRLWEGDLRRSPEYKTLGAATERAPAVSENSPRRLDVGSLFTMALKAEAERGGPSTATGTAVQAEECKVKSAGGENLRRIDVMDLLGFSAESSRPRPRAEASRADVDGVRFAFHEHHPPITNLLYGSGRASSATNLSVAARQSLMRANKLDQWTTIE